MSLSDFDVEFFMQCSDCGSELKPDHRFCLTCGRSVDPLPPPSRDIKTTIKEHSTKCSHCGEQLKHSQPFCPMCGCFLGAISRPLKVFNITLEELIGWSKDKVIATLGQPDSKKEGAVWPAVGLTKPCSELVVCPDGYVRETYVFGPVPKRIHYPTAYEVWTYENVQRSTWLLYLKRAGEDPGESSASHKAAQDRRSFWQKLMGRSRSLYKERSLSEPLLPPKKLRPSDPLVVVEVNSYPTGAVF